MLNNHLVFSKKLPRGQFAVFNQRPEIDFYRVTQIHSNIVLSSSELTNQEADGIVGEDAKALAILTADCLPIVLIGESRHAVVHAGWRGLHSNILASNLLSEIKPFYAFIGPHICPKHYEVQSEFKKNFTDSQLYLEENEQIFFNLELAARKQLKELFGTINIESAQLCTFEHQDLHSFRRNKTEKRNWNLYIPTGS